MSRVVVITGGSSGIGKATAINIRDKGCRVYELSRRDSVIAGITHIKTDITDEWSVSEAIDIIIKKEGHIDVLVNNAGWGISGAVEFTSAKEAEKLFNVNFLGTVRVTREVLAHMRSRKSGKIINISSVAAVVPIPFQAFYSASKAAVNSYSAALSNEVRSFGITVSVVMPGDIKSGFTDAREKIPDGDEIYGGRISRSVGTMEKDERNGMSAEKAGEFIANVILKKKNKLLYTVGFGYKCAVLLTKLLPSALLNKIIGMLYAK